MTTCQSNNKTKMCNQSLIRSDCRNILHIKKIKFLRHSKQGESKMPLCFCRLGSFLRSLCKTSCKQDADENRAYFGLSNLKSLSIYSC